MIICEIKENNFLNRQSAFYYVQNYYSHYIFLKISIWHTPVVIGTHLNNAFLSVRLRATQFRWMIFHLLFIICLVYLLNDARLEPIIDRSQRMRPR